MLMLMEIRLDLLIMELKILKMLKFNLKKFNEYQDQAFMLVKILHLNKYYYNLKEIMFDYGNKFILEGF